MEMPKGERNPVPKSVTSITVETDLIVRARKKGLRLSKVFNDALRSLLDSGLEAPDPTEAQIEALQQARARRIEERILRIKEQESLDREAGLQMLQSAWNQYVAAGDKPHDAKISWIDSRKERILPLAGISSEEILKELGG